MSYRNARKGAWLLGAALALAASSGGRASAQTACASLPGTIIYGAGGSAQTPLVGRVAKVFANATSPITIVYQDAGGACTGIDAMTGFASGKITGTAWYWTTAGTKTACNLAVGGDTVQFASMGNGPLQCANTAAAVAADPNALSAIIDEEGPISVVDLFVPPLSTETTISAAALYLLYGRGAAAGIAPYTDDNALIHRNAASYVQLYIGLATGLGAGNFLHGQDAKTNPASISLVAAYNSTAPNTSIGFASAETVESTPGNTVRVIAYQHWDQGCGYTPDSSPSSHDKANVRDGHYFLWGPGHFYAFNDGSSHTDGLNHFQNAAVASVFDFIQGGAAPAGVTGAGNDILDIAIANHNVPQCAMSVTRAGDLGPLASYVVPESLGGPCACYFEKNANGTTACQACPGGTDAECTSGGKCRRNYCEAY